MARKIPLQIIRSTRANLDAAKAASQLLAGELYLVTDENKVAIGVSATAYVDVSISSHSALANLSADDHPQYHTDTRGDARYLKLTGGTVTGNITAAQLTTTGNLVCQNGVLDFGQQTRQQINLWTAAYGIGVQGGTLYLRCGQQFSFHQGGVHSDTAADPGAGGIELARLRSDGFHLNPANVGSMWFRSYGATGWYSNTYGGGWHMSDATHIRSYGGKSVCIDHLFDGYGNLHLRGNANYISCYDTDDGRKWLFGCDQDGFYVQRTNTASESAGDFVWKFRIAADGTLYTPSLAGTGNRAVYSDPSGNLTNTASDRRLKTNIAPLSYGLAEVLRLSPVSFRWKDPKLGGQTEIGLIAQDVQAIIPEVIGRNADDLLSLDYPKLVAVLINAIKTLNTRIQTLEARP